MATVREFIQRRGACRSLVQFCVVGLLLTTHNGDAAPVDSHAQHFDANKAWHEFVELMTFKYGYLDRQGVDGANVLNHFAPLAIHAHSKVQFVQLLKVVVRNFADPHLDITPHEKSDYSVIPTGSDLYGEFKDNKFVIVDVRANSDAAKQGIVSAAIVDSVDGQATDKVVEQLLGRPIAALSPLQISYGLNIALAGLRNHERRLRFIINSKATTYTLRATYEQAKAVDLLPAVEYEQRSNLGIIRINNSLGRTETIKDFADALKQLMDTQVLLIDLRNTPSGGNTTIARGIMGHFVEHEMPYQIHVVPEEERRFGVPRKFTEYVLPIKPFYPGHVYVLGGRWTGSMGEGLMIGFDALGIKTVGSELGHLLGAKFDESLPRCGVTVSLGEEQLFHVNGMPREGFHSVIYLSPTERNGALDPAFEAVLRYEATMQTTTRQ